MILFVALLVVLAVLSGKLSSRLGLPLLIGFILIGILVGSDVLNLFYFDDAHLTKRVADILLIFLIFDGGFRVARESFARVAGPSLTLATLGVALTAAALGLFVHLVLGFDLVYSFLIASIISSTDAAAVFMITRANPIRSNLATTLNVESAANDPMAILLTVTFVEAYSKAFDEPLRALLSLFWQFGGGVLVGLLCFKLAALAFRLLNSDNRGNYSLLAVGGVLFAYGLSELVRANGIIAVFFMGYWLGNSRFPGKAGVAGFLESISSIFNVALFIMLGLLSFPGRLGKVWAEASLVVLAMMFVARPLAVFVCTIPFKYSFREKLLLTWGGIKGAVPIVLATYPAAAGLDGDGFVFDTIFLAVLASCVLQGTTLGPLARLLKLNEKPRPHSPYTVELHALRESDLDMYEFHVERGSRCAGSRLAELELGSEVLVSSIVREGRLILPKGKTEIREEDILYVLAPAAQVERLAARFGA